MCLLYSVCSLPLQHIVGTKHVDFYLRWVSHLFTLHGRVLADPIRAAEALPTLRALQKNIKHHHKTLSKRYVGMHPWNGC